MDNNNKKIIMLTKNTVHQMSIAVVSYFNIVMTQKGCFFCADVQLPNCSPSHWLPAG